MKPINAGQRRKAFMVFTLLFAITCSMVVGIVFFNYQISNKENAYLQEKLKYYSLKMEEQEQFVKQMHKVRSLLDTIDYKGVSKEYVGQKITNELVFMENNYATKDSTFLGDMYNNVILTYLELKAAKLDLQDFEDVNSDMDAYIETIEELKSKLSTTERELAIARQYRN